MGNKNSQFDQYPNLGFKPARILKALEVANDNPDGFTISNDMSEMPQTGYAVALAATQGSFGLSGFLRALAFAIDKGLYFGGWLNKEDGQYYWDAVRVFAPAKYEAAMKFAALNKQIAIYDLNEQVVIPVGTFRNEIKTNVLNFDWNNPAVLDSDGIIRNPFNGQEVEEPFDPGSEEEFMSPITFEPDEDVVLPGSTTEHIKDVLKAADDYEYRFHTWREGKELFIIQDTCGHGLSIGSKVVVLNPTTFNNESFYDVNFVGGEAGDWYQIHQDDLGE